MSTGEKVVLGCSVVGAVVAIILLMKPPAIVPPDAEIISVEFTVVK